MGRQLLQIWFLAALVLVVCAARRAPESRFDSAAAVETFDRAWTIIYETHFDTEFNGVDWPAVRDELRPKAEEAGSVEELRGVIREMILRLGQSHFALIPGRLAEQDPLLSPAGEGDSAPGGDGQVGIDLRLVDDRFVVRSVEPGRAADQAGVRPGWILLAVGDREIDDWKSSYGEIDDGPAGRYIATESALARLSGSPGSAVELKFVDGSNTRVSVKLKREPPVGQRVQLASLPPFFARLWSDELRPTDLGIEVGLIRLNIWMPALSRPFAEAVNSFREADGMIIDLRGNPGGVGGMVMGIAGHFLDEPVALGTLAMRNQKLEFRANPRRVNPAGERVKPFGGPVAILIDELSASTSELFAGGMQDIGRARIFGTRSAGMALPAVTERLPNRDILYHAIADLTTPSGTRIEHNGVVPDVEIPLARADLLAGHDATLEAALHWIAEESNRQSTGGGS